MMFNVKNVIELGCEEVVVWKSGDDKERHKLQVLEMKFLRSMR